jgi:prepilin-type processing-associated H-X9-DG protein
MSWLTRILPFVEEQALWRDAESAFAQDPWFESVPPHYGLGTVVKKYTCPADNRAQKVSILGTAFTSYLGVEGTDQFSKDGMLFLDSRLRISDATDGSSNTLLVGERPPSHDAVLGWWYAGWGQDRDGSGDMVLGAREHNVCKFYVTPCRNGPYEYGPGRENDPCSAFHFWSFHPGGANFLFCDGSVHFLPYAANRILPALATRRGGEIVDTSSLD